LGHVQPITPLNGRVPTFAELSEVTRALRADPGIAWDFIIDGCQARAHLMSQALTARGINNAKLFVNGGRSNPLRGELEFENELMRAHWSFHAAPWVFAKDTDGRVKPFIVDPAVSPVPLAPDAWLRKFAKKPVTLDLTGPAQYAPLRDGKVDTDFDANLDDAKALMKKYAEVAERYRRFKPLRDVFERARDWFEDAVTPG
jgi:hypothetical protein